MNIAAVAGPISPKLPPPAKVVIVPGPVPTVEGVMITTGGIPVPVKLIVTVGVNGSLETMVNVAVFEPFADGANFTSKVQLTPEVIVGVVLAQVPPLVTILKSPLPVMLMAGEIVSGAKPVLLMVIGVDALLPTITLLNGIGEAGVTDMAGVVVSRVMELLYGADQLPATSLNFT